MGRHKKDCQCPLCTQKKYTQDIPQPEIRQDVMNDIKESAQNEKTSTASETTFFETDDVQDAAEPVLRPDISQPEPTPQEPTIEEKAEKLKFIVRPLIVSMYNLIFERMNVNKLAKTEEDTLTNAWSMVIAKYSQVYEFKYKEEASLLIVNVAILFPRINEYKKKSAEQAQPTIEEKLEGIHVEV